MCRRIKYGKISIGMIQLVSGPSWSSLSFVCGTFMFGAEISCSWKKLTFILPGEHLGRGRPCLEKRPSQVKGRNMDVRWSCLNQTDWCFFPFSFEIVHGLITHRGSREDLGFLLFHHFWRIIVIFWFIFWAKGLRTHYFSHMD